VTHFHAGDVHAVGGFDLGRKAITQGACFDPLAPGFVN